MRFKVIQGTHWINRIAYPSGSTVESDQRLDRAFPGRFQLLEKKAVEKIPEVDTQIISDPEPEPEPETALPEEPDTEVEPKKAVPPKRKIRRKKAK